MSGENRTTFWAAAVVLITLASFLVLVLCYSGKPAGAEPAGDPVPVEEINPDGVHALTCAIDATMLPPEHRRPSCERKEAGSE